MYRYTSLRREPMAYDPELVLAKAHFGAESVSSFLFENFPEFVHDDSIEDAAMGLGYLSDAAILARGGLEGVSGGGFGGGGGGGGGGVGLCCTS